MLSIKYQQEFLSQFKSDAQDLLEQDWDEIEHKKDLRKLNPDWSIYELLEKQGQLYIFTCRDDLKLVGYFVVIITPNLHSRGDTLAVADVIYLDKGYRSGSLGYKLFLFAESCIRNDGYKTLQVTTTEMNPIDPLMLKLGYAKVETKFEKVL
jgi:GNAT superfamily N-acetyltransferase